MGKQFSREELACFENSSIRNKDIKATPFFHGLVDQSLTCFWLGDISRHLNQLSGRQALASASALDLLRSFQQAVLVFCVMWKIEVIHGDIGALPEVFQRYGSANACCTASNASCFPTQ